MHGLDWSGDVCAPNKRHEIWRKCVYRVEREEARAASLVVKYLCYMCLLMGGGLRLSASVMLTIFTLPILSCFITRTRQIHYQVMEGKDQLIKSAPAKPIDQTIQDYLEELKGLVNTCDAKQRYFIISKLWEILDCKSRLPDADRNLATGNARLVQEDKYDGEYSGFGDYHMSDPTDESLYQNEEPSPKKRLLGFIDGSTVETCDKSARDTTGLTNVVDIDITIDAYAVKGHFLSLWINCDLLIDDDLKKHIQKKTLERRKPQIATCAQWVAWNDGHFYTTKDTPNLLRTRHPSGFLPENGTPFRASRRISSQLLFYRLLAVFGMPPSSEMNYLDRYKSIWRYTLYWLDDVQNENIAEEWKSQLIFEDWKGWWSVSYYGIDVAEQSALKLIEWLFSNNVPHPYDYTVAGRVA